MHAHNTHTQTQTQREENQYGTISSVVLYKKQHTVQFKLVSMPSEKHILGEIDRVAS